MSVEISLETLVEGIKSGDKRLIAKAITLVESKKLEHREKAEQLLKAIMPLTGKSIRVGITGVPGAGKSTFIESFGQLAIKNGKKVAVLAIDPSSAINKGSILGDKTRMEDLAKDPNAFIRPSPSSGFLGGVANATFETMLICEAAGYDYILIETVGVGQSEVLVADISDVFLFLKIIGGGDELQGIKRGIMEMADGIAINKCDGSNVEKSQLAKRQFQNALHLFPAPESGWKPEVITCSATEKNGIPELWEMVQNYIHFTKENGYFENKRTYQSKYWMYESINDKLKSDFYNNEVIQKLLETAERRVLSNEISSFIAAKDLLSAYKKIQ